jgi:protein TonB
LKRLLVDKARPSYPDASKRAHEQGVVIIHINVGVNGAVDEARVEFSPYDRLGSAALDGVKHWKYKPYRVDGHPKAFSTTVFVAFFQ